jgi:hypothetical protein
VGAAGEREDMRSPCTGVKKEIDRVLNRLGSNDKPSRRGVSFLSLLLSGKPHFYEKVVKVKADVVAILKSSLPISP